MRIVRPISSPICHILGLSGGYKCILLVVFFGVWLFGPELPVAGHQAHMASLEVTPLVTEALPRAGREGTIQIQGLLSILLRA